MKNPDTWKPTKYVYRNRRLTGSRDRNEVGVASRLAADLTAAAYDERLPRYASGRLLDLGCGEVPLHQAYAGHIDQSVCVDWGNTLHPNVHLDYECDLTQPLPFGDSSFQTIILSDVLEHIPEPQRLWSEMARVLAPGGKLLVNVPFFYPLHERPHDYYRYTEFALRRFVSESGLELVELETTGGTPEILADVLAKHLQHLPLIGATLAVFVQYCTALLIRTTAGRKLSRKTSAAFPFGYFVVAGKPGET